MPQVLRLLPVLGMFLLWSSCTKDHAENPTDVTLEQRLMRLSTTGGLDGWQVPHHENLAAIPAGIANPITKEKVELGKMLFFETGLARDAVHAEGVGTYSCSSCHVPSAGFMPGRMQGIADGAYGFGVNGESRSMSTNYQENEIDAQGARPLSMIGVAYVTNSMWAGRFGARFNNENTEYAWHEADGTSVNHTGLDGLEAQNIEGTKVHRMRIDGYVLDSLGYRAMFDAAFYDWPLNARYGREAMSFALSAYIRTIMPYEAPFQRWLRGERNAMTEQEKRGAIVFFTQGGCYRCHKSPALNSNEFHAVGVNDLHMIGGLKTSESDARNFGRGHFTGRDSELYAFKVPQLYNLKTSPFYFHGSSHHSLRSVVEYFNEGRAENANVGEQYLSQYFHPLNLSDEQMDDLTAFLTTGLYDPNMERYKPSAVLSGNCMPNNDPISRRQLGCD